MIKMSRGIHYEITSTLGIGLMKWYDHKLITIASN